ncbi:hypothetical protein F0P96_04390 [Hymenobacter busanensis]|uniref:Uncharacterized protein n=1 Tax=Hymenobacter busanensis TaxID=2607656 RepID=A0A7L4ZU82_9BACT|nr:hypothetical protein [Hymenobacter busanensis]KAA9339861.1 hypothetical protein F0P96_04390 [Hymenobacter busanensis]QHJ06385.1 hypothetical protein GUY19_03350 [Hymenobacter busanensis]
MPKTIDYPRTGYLSAWEVAEIVDDTGGKCSIEACARKLNRKVSGSFKAILGSAVKFGLLTSKREMLTTTNLFRRIKNAYDKNEEKIYHREAFLHPPLFSHICRKFRNRELPVHILDVMLVREFDVEEINAQNVAKAFVEGARMVDIIDERNIIADIDQLAQAMPRRDVLASPEMPVNLFPNQVASETNNEAVVAAKASDIRLSGVDAVSTLFGLVATGTPANTTESNPTIPPIDMPRPETLGLPNLPAKTAEAQIPSGAPIAPPTSQPVHYTIRISGPGIDSQLSVQDQDDLLIVTALIDKIKKRLG